ncbi:uncharacterized protein C8Q71DRAFT_485208 [Rhodofomes roseus]|uniref:Uncharacterized protein n=1 Tax=Rhodofomes roseus TaxID=34475 RepID=A0ABQ8KPD0_9APHY|nr:uncharacterized protein C8Q71DRAFT_485208 [Rhodofomes roseus]KAH9840282.1 hypothetical protein C8Q71DRAFT_485208 [Rhodofomes roseus]
MRYFTIALLAMSTVAPVLALPVYSNAARDVAGTLLERTFEHDLDARFDADSMLLRHDFLDSRMDALLMALERRGKPESGYVTKPSKPTRPKCLEPLDVRSDVDDVLMNLERRGKVDSGYVTSKPKPKPARPKRRNILEARLDFDDL